MIHKKLRNRERGNLRIIFLIIVFSCLYSEKKNISLCSFRFIIFLWIWIEKMIQNGKQVTTPTEQFRLSLRSSWLGEDWIASWKLIATHHSNLGVNNAVSCLAISQIRARDMKPFSHAAFHLLSVLLNSARTFLQTLHNNDFGSLITIKNI